MIFLLKRIGNNSLGIIVPKENTEILEIKEGDVVHLDIIKDVIMKTYKCDRCLSDFKYDENYIPECPYCGWDKCFEVVNGEIKS